MLRPPSFESPQKGIARGYTFPMIDTINEGEQQNESPNPFEKSFQSLSLKNVSSRDTTDFEPPLVQKHTKEDSINSIDTLNSLRLKRFSSSSSIPSTGDLTSSPTTPNNFKKNIIRYQVPPRVQLITNTEASLIIESENVLIVDVRPFIDFNRAHLRNSINFNLPSTLIKRPNFTLMKCLGNISMLESAKLKTFLDKDTQSKKIIIYDDAPVLNNEVSLGVYGSLTKFLNHEEYKGELCVLQFGFQTFKTEFQELLEVAEVPQDTNDIFMPPNPHFQHGSMSLKPPPHRSISLSNLSTSPFATTSTGTTNTCSYSNPSSSSPISPNLSRFQLPKLPKTPVFKIRHNEETYDFDNYKILNEFSHLTSSLNKGASESLPDWLQVLLNESNSSSTLINNFQNLEIKEKNRINEMVSSNSICCGIELGFKNRYKGIFPYEHSRVKLSLTPSSEEVDFDKLNYMNYINANYISCPKMSNMKYIATQAPLYETLKDFGKLIKDNNIDIIIALTTQFENGVEKCYPYWEDKEIVEVFETKQLNNISIRRLFLKTIEKEVIQIQITNWSDYDVVLNSQQDDVLRLIYLKKILMNSLGIWDENVLVHCSAGCGRTGAFCTLDSIINQNSNDSKDPIFDIVEDFRNQRISMVQNLRQYLFIYDCLCNYYENLPKYDCYQVELNELSILNNFVNDKRQQRQYSA